MSHTATGACKAKLPVFFVVVPFFVMTLIDDLKYELTFFFLSPLLLHVRPTFISVFHVYQHRQGAVIAKINAAYLPAAFTIRPNEINNPP